MKLSHVRHRVRGTAMLLLLSVVPAACGDDSTGPGNDDLTQAEVEALVEALGVVGAFDLEMAELASARMVASATAAAARGVPAGASAAVPVTETISETVACPEGGSVVVAGTISGDVDDDTGTGTVSFDLTHTHERCKATAPSSGMTFTFDGAPRVEMAADMTITENGFSLSGSQEGAIEWRKGGESGSCTIDLAFDLEGC